MEAAAWGAVATVAAVVVALLKEEIVGLWRKPKLTTSISLSAPDCTKTSLGVDTYQLRAQRIFSIDCYYFRLRVKNEGNRRAEKVQVYANKLFKKHADDIYHEVETFLPMNLRWSHSQPGPPEIFADISPSMGRHCDFGYIADPGQRVRIGDDLPGVAADKTLYHLELEAKPRTRSHLLPPGYYRLELHIGAGNVQRRITTHIQFSHSGVWFADEARMFSEAVGIRQLE